MIRVDTRPRRKNAPRPAEKSATAYLQWLRGRPCHLAKSPQGGCGEGDPPRKSPIEACHVERGGDRGMSSKVSDRFAIPMCQRHHDEQHGHSGAFRNRGGWRTFQLKYGFNALQVAEEYWRRWPGRAAWEAKHDV